MYRIILCEVVHLIRINAVPDSDIFFKVKETNKTRGHKFTLVKEQSRLDVRKCSFTQRTINVLINYQLIVCMLVVIIYKYLVKTGYT